MAEYTVAYEMAVNHAMLYEVGSFWDVSKPGVKEGLIDTVAQRRAVGYVNDPDDHGGETKYGIAKNANADLNITTLTWEAAKRVYYKRYWLAGDCQDMPGRLAILHFDGCINHSTFRGAKFIQTSVGTTADGDIGPATIAAILSNNEIEICNRVCDLREQFYQDIVAKNPSQGKYLSGWLRRIYEMRLYVTDPSKTV